MRGGYVTLPSPETLRMAHVEIDLASMMWERALQKTNTYLRYFYADASPQLDWNFLMVREDRIRLPRRSDPSTLPVYFNLSDHYEERICPASVIGHRNAKWIKKSINVSNIYLMESDDNEMWDEKRRELRGGCVDQGTEKGLGDDSIKCHAQFSDYDPEDSDDLFIYPLILMIPGMLHVLYNALQEGIESCDGYKQWIDHLRCVQQFFQIRLSAVPFVPLACTRKVNGRSSSSTASRTSIGNGSS